MTSNLPAEGSAADLLKAYLDVVVISEAMQARAWETAQLTLTQVRVLRRLAREPRPLGQLGAELSLAPPSMTRLADRLEERGLIERTRDGEDRRRVVAALTEKGRLLAGALPTFEGTALKAAAERLPAPERARCARAFREFAAAVHELEQPAVPAGAGA